MNIMQYCSITAAVAALFLAATGGAAELAWPPTMPGGKTVDTFTSTETLEPTDTLLASVAIADQPATITFAYYPGQNYPGKPWSVWGDSIAVDGKYYSSIGDHKAPDGNAFVYEYDAKSKRLHKVVDLAALLKRPEGHYRPGKIHSRLDIGRDGRLYFSTHRGSTRVTTDQYHYQGDWIASYDPASGEAQVVVHAPVAKHCIPTSVLDPDRLIFYGGTASGDRQDKSVMFFAYDIGKRMVLHTAPDGPYRYLIFARSTGRVYYCNEDYGTLMRYDPEDARPPQPIDGHLGLRSATRETPDGYVYTVSSKGDAALYRFDTKTERIDKLGDAPVGSQTYITSIDADLTGRYLYYVPGAHGGAENDGTPVVQCDVKTARKKVIAFLYPALKRRYGYVPIGTFASALSPDGTRLYITFNGSRDRADNRGRYPFDTCALVVVDIPEAERTP